MLTNEQVMQALSTVQDPELGRDLVSLRYDSRSGHQGWLGLFHTISDHSRLPFKGSYGK